MLRKQWHHGWSLYVIVLFRPSMWLPHVMCFSYLLSDSYLRCFTMNTSQLAQLFFSYEVSGLSFQQSMSTWYLPLMSLRCCRQSCLHRVQQQNIWPSALGYTLQCSLRTLLRTSHREPFLLSCEQEHTHDRLPTYKAFDLISASLFMLSSTVKHFLPTSTRWTAYNFVAKSTFLSFLTLAIATKEVENSNSPQRFCTPHTVRTKERNAVVCDNTRKRNPPTKNLQSVALYKRCRLWLADQNSRNSKKIKGKRRQPPSSLFLPLEYAANSFALRTDSNAEKAWKREEKRKRTAIAQVGEGTQLTKQEHSLSPDIFGALRASTEAQCCEALG